MNLQTNSNQKGFTIVELLIVIVVIGILAAITIVAFNGVQSRAKATSAKATASGVQKKIEAFNAATTSYPTSTTAATMTTELNGQNESKLGDLKIGTPSDSNGQTTVGIYRCATAGVSGYSIVWWDYTAGSPAAKSAADGLKAGDSCTTWAATMI